MIAHASTETGVARLLEAARAHARGIARYFASRLSSEEIAVLETALGKVTIDCSFG